jgi:hypothetical protein
MPHAITTAGRPRALAVAGVLTALVSTAGLVTPATVLAQTTAPPLAQGGRVEFGIAFLIGGSTSDRNFDPGIASVSRPGPSLLLGYVPSGMRPRRASAATAIPSRNPERSSGLRH